MRAIKQRNWEKGAAMVEFAIIAWVLFLILFGIIEFGCLLYDKAVITNASREGTRAGIVYAPTRASTAEIKAVVINYLSENLITFGPQSPPTITTLIDGAPGDPSTLPPLPPASGARLTVDVSYHYDFLVIPNFITNLVGGINLLGSTTMRFE